MKKRSDLIFLLLCVVLVIPGLLGLVHQGFFLTDDGNWMVIRFSAFYEALRNGQFPVRFLFRLNNGFGYPVADFLYPLFMYLGVPIHVLGFNFMSTIKIILGLSLIFSSIFTFLWLKKLFDNLSSLVGATFYALFPYHLWDIYKRGSVGEVLAMSIAPFIFWQIERKNYLFIGAGIALLITAHNSLAFIFLPLIFLYMLLKKEINNLIKSFVLGFSLSAFFWIPALYDKQFTVFDKTNVSIFSSYFVTAKDLNILGPAFLLVVLTSIVIAFFKRNKEQVYFLTVTLVTSILLFPLSFIFWKYTPLDKFIQFPFRLISFVILSSSFLISYQLNLLKGKTKIIPAVFYLIVILFSAKEFIYPKFYQYYPDSFYSTNQDSTTVKNEYMPKWVKNLPQGQQARITVISGNGTVQNQSTNNNKTTFSLYTLEKSLVQFNSVYFPGWVVKVDNKTAVIDYKTNGFIRFFVDRGNRNINIYFTETPLRLFSDLITLAGLIALTVLAIKNRRAIFK